MKRFALRAGRVFTAAVSVGVLSVAALAPAGADQQSLGPAGSAVFPCLHPSQVSPDCVRPAAVMQPVIVSPGVPASVYWPPRDVGTPGGWVDYHLTDAYWSRFRSCRLASPFAACRDTVLAQYEVRRIA